MFGGLFRRKPVPSPGDSPETWNVGDMAESLADGWAHFPSHTRSDGPKRGEVRMVAKVAIHPTGAQLLIFKRYPGHRFTASAFRKITPRQDEAVRADHEWIADLIGAPIREQA